MTHLRSSEHSPGELLDPGVRIWGGVSISVPGEVGATEGFKWRGVCCQVGLGGHTVTAWRTAFSLEALSQAAAEDSWEGGSQRLWVPDMGRKWGEGEWGDSRPATFRLDSGRQRDHLRLVKAQVASPRPEIRLGREFTVLTSSQVVLLLLGQARNQDARLRAPVAVWIPETLRLGIRGAGGSSGVNRKSHSCSKIWAVWAPRDHSCPAVSGPWRS